MNNKMNKCPICGYYTVKDMGDICPVCFAELGYDDIIGNKWMKKLKNNYEKNGVCNDCGSDSVRQPRGIELPGFYEPDNIEAQNDPRYLYTKQCYENDEELFHSAAYTLYDYLTNEEMKDDNTHNGISKDEVFNILNALAYKDDYIGLVSAFNLALCYAAGYGCKKDYGETESTLYDIMKYFEVRSSNEVLN